MPRRGQRYAHRHRREQRGDSASRTTGSAVDGIGVILSECNAFSQVKIDSNTVNNNGPRDGINVSTVAGTTPVGAVAVINNPVTTSAGGANGIHVVGQPATVMCLRVNGNAATTASVAAGNFDYNLQAASGTTVSLENGTAATDAAGALALNNPSSVQNHPTTQATGVIALIAPNNCGV